MTYKIFVIVLLSVMMPWSAGAASTKHAMLVGVTKYPSLNEHYQLDGPANDVQITQKMLSQKGFEASNMLIFAEQGKGAKEPTRANIMAGLNTLAERAHEGDFVYIQFGGHGSRQPAPENSDEPDGLDEIFLPKDIGTWDDDIGAVKNAIVDDEIRDALLKIRSRGAFVMAMFDSCHSGTMTRGNLKMRRVDESALGIPERGFSLATNRVIHSRGKSDQNSDTMMRGGQDSKKMGGLVAFYAAQSTQQTPEMTMGDDSDPKAYGLFTYSVMNALGSSSNISYRQLSEQVVQLYKMRGWSGSTPLVEGDQDVGVFGGEVGKPIRQWELVEDDAGSLTMKAGRMHMLNEGAILAVMPKATADKDEVLGYLKISAISEFESTLAATKKEDGYKGFDIGKFKDGQFARLVDPNIKYEIRLYALEKGNALRDLDAVIQKFKRDGIDQVQVKWVDKKELADLQIVSDEYHLVHLLPQEESVDDDNSISGSFVIAAGGRAQTFNGVSLETWLGKSIATIAKVKNLKQLSGSMGDSYPDVEMKIVVKRKSESNIEFDGLTTAPDLKDKDVVEFMVNNEANTAMDITVLFMDRNYGLESLFPLKGQSNRIESMAKKVIKLGTINTNTVGREGLIVIAVPAEDTAVRSDFSFLAQPAIAVAKSATSRGVGGVSDARSLFENAGFNIPKSRGLGGGGSSEFQMRVIEWNTVR